MCDIVWISPQSHSSLSVKPHFLWHALYSGPGLSGNDSAVTTDVGEDQNREVGLWLDPIRQIYATVTVTWSCVLRFQRRRQSKKWKERGGSGSRGNRMTQMGRGKRPREYIHRPTVCRLLHAMALWQRPHERTYNTVNASASSLPVGLTPPTRGSYLG